MKAAHKETIALLNAMDENLANRGLLYKCARDSTSMHTNLEQQPSSDAYLTYIHVVAKKHRHQVREQEYRRYLLQQQQQQQKEKEKEKDEKVQQQHRRRHEKSVRKEKKRIDGTPGTKTQLQLNSTAVECSISAVSKGSMSHTQGAAARSTKTPSLPSSLLFGSATCPVWSRTSCCSIPHSDLIATPILPQLSLNKNTNSSNSNDDDSAIATGCNRKSNNLQRIKNNDRCDSINSSDSNYNMYRISPVSCNSAQAVLRCNSSLRIHSRSHSAGWQYCRELCDSVVGLAITVADSRCLSVLDLHGQPVLRKRQDLSVTAWRRWWAESLSCHLRSEKRMLDEDEKQKTGTPERMRAAAAAAGMKSINSSDGQTKRRASCSKVSTSVITQEAIQAQLSTAAAQHRAHNKSLITHAVTRSLRTIRDGAKWRCAAALAAVRTRHDSCALLRTEERTHSSDKHDNEEDENSIDINIRLDKRKSNNNTDDGENMDVNNDTIIVEVDEKNVNQAEAALSSIPEVTLPTDWAQRLPPAGYFLYGDETSGNAVLAAAVEWGLSCSTIAAAATMAHAHANTHIQSNSHSNEFSTTTTSNDDDKATSSSGRQSSADIHHSSAMSNDHGTDPLSGLSAVRVFAPMRGKAPTKSLTNQVRKEKNADNKDESVNVVEIARSPRNARVPTATPTTAGHPPRTVTDNFLAAVASISQVRRDSISNGNVLKIAELQEQQQQQRSPHSCFETKSDSESLACCRTWAGMSRSGEGDSSMWGMRLGGQDGVECMIVTPRTLTGVLSPPSRMMLASHENYTQGSALLNNGTVSNSNNNNTNNNLMSSVGPDNAANAGISSSVNGLAGRVRVSNPASRSYGNSHTRGVLANEVMERESRRDAELVMASLVRELVSVYRHNLNILAREILITEGSCSSKSDSNSSSTSDSTSNHNDSNSISNSGNDHHANVHKYNVINVIANTNNNNNGKGFRIHSNSTRSSSTHGDSNGNKMHSHMSRTSSMYRSHDGSVASHASKSNRSGAAVREGVAPNTSSPLDRDKSEEQQKRAANYLILSLPAKRSLLLVGFPQTDEFYTRLRRELNKAMSLLEAKMLQSTSSCAAGNPLTSHSAGADSRTARSSMNNTCNKTDNKNNKKKNTSTDDKITNNNSSSSNNNNKSKSNKNGINRNDDMNHKDNDNKGTTSVKNDASAATKAARSGNVKATGSSRGGKSSSSLPSSPSSHCSSCVSSPLGGESGGASVLARWSRLPPLCITGYFVNCETDTRYTRWQAGGGAVVTTLTRTDRDESEMLCRTDSTSTRRKLGHVSNVGSPFHSNLFGIHSNDGCVSSNNNNNAMAASVNANTNDVSNNLSVTATSNNTNYSRHNSSTSMNILRRANRIASVHTRGCSALTYRAAMDVMAMRAELQRQGELASMWQRRWCEAFCNVTPLSSPTHTEAAQEPTVTSPCALPLSSCTTNNNNNTTNSSSSGNNCGTMISTSSSSSATATRESGNKDRGQILGKLRGIMKATQAVKQAQERHSTSTRENSTGHANANRTSHASRNSSPFGAAEDASAPVRRKSKQIFPRVTDTAAGSEAEVRQQQHSPLNSRKDNVPFKLYDYGACDYDEDGEKDDALPVRSENGTLMHAHLPRVLYYCVVANVCDDDARSGAARTSQSTATSKVNHNNVNNNDSAKTVNTSTCDRMYDSSNTCITSNINTSSSIPGAHTISSSSFSYEAMFIPPVFRSLSHIHWIMLWRLLRNLACHVSLTQLSYRRGARTLVPNQLPAPLQPEDYSRSSAVHSELMRTYRRVARRAKVNAAQDAVPVTAACAEATTERDGLQPQRTGQTTRSEVRMPCMQTHAAVAAGRTAGGSARWWDKDSSETEDEKRCYVEALYAELAVYRVLDRCLARSLHIVRTEALPTPTCTGETTSTRSSRSIDARNGADEDVNGASHSDNHTFPTITTNYSSSNTTDDKSRAHALTSALVREMGSTHKAQKQTLQAYNLPQHAPRDMEHYGNGRNSDTGTFAITQRRADASCTTLSANACGLRTMHTKMYANSGGGSSSRSESKHNITDKSGDNTKSKRAANKNESNNNTYSCRDNKRDCLNDGAECKYMHASRTIYYAAMDRNYTHCRNLLDAVALRECEDALRWHGAVWLRTILATSRFALARALQLLGVALLLQQQQTTTKGANNNNNRNDCSRPTNYNNNSGSSAVISEISDIHNNNSDDCTGSNNSDTTVHAMSDGASSNRLGTNPSILPMDSSATSQSQQSHCAAAAALATEPLSESVAGPRHQQSSACAGVLETAFLAAVTLPAVEELLPISALLLQYTAVRTTRACMSATAGANMSWWNGEEEFGKERMRETTLGKPDRSSRSNERNMSNSYDRVDDEDARFVESSSSMASSPAHVASSLSSFSSSSCYSVLTNSMREGAKEDGGGVLWEIIPNESMEDRDAAGSLSVGAVWVRLSEYATLWESIAIDCLLAYLASHGASVAPIDSLHTVYPSRNNNAKKNVSDSYFDATTANRENATTSYTDRRKWSRSAKTDASSRASSYSDSFVPSEPCITRYASAVMFADGTEPAFSRRHERDAQSDESAREQSATHSYLHTGVTSSEVADVQRAVEELVDTLLFPQYRNRNNSSFGTVSSKNRSTSFSSPYIMRWAVQLRAVWRCVRAGWRGAERWLYALYQAALSCPSCVTRGAVVDACNTKVPNMGDQDGEDTNRKDSKHNDVSDNDTNGVGSECIDCVRHTRPQVVDDLFREPPKHIWRTQQSRNNADTDGSNSDITNSITQDTNCDSSNVFPTETTARRSSAGTASAVPWWLTLSLSSYALYGVPWLTEEEFVHCATLTQLPQMSGWVASWPHMSSTTSLCPSSCMDCTRYDSNSMPSHRNSRICDSVSSNSSDGTSSRNSSGRRSSSDSHADRAMQHDTCTSYHEKGNYDCVKEPANQEQRHDDGDADAVCTLDECDTWGRGSLRGVGLLPTSVSSPKRQRSRLPFCSLSEMRDVFAQFARLSSSSRAHSSKRTSRCSSHATHLLDDHSRTNTNSDHNTVSNANSSISESRNVSTDSSNTNNRTNRATNYYKYDNDDSKPRMYVHDYVWAGLRYWGEACAAVHESRQAHTAPTTRGLRQAMTWLPPHTDNHTLAESVLHVRDVAWWPFDAHNFVAASFCPPACLSAITAADTASSFMRVRYQEEQNRTLWQPHQKTMLRRSSHEQQQHSTLSEHDARLLWCWVCAEYCHLSMRGVCFVARAPTQRQHALSRLLARYAQVSVVPGPVKLSDRRGGRSGSSDSDQAVMCVSRMFHMIAVLKQRAVLAHTMSHELQSRRTRGVIRESADVEDVNAMRENCAAELFRMRWGEAASAMAAATVELSPSEFARYFAAMDKCCDSTDNTSNNSPMDEDICFEDRQEQNLIDETYTSAFGGRCERKQGAMDLRTDAELLLRSTQSQSITLTLLLSSHWGRVLIEEHFL